MNLRRSTRKVHDIIASLEDKEAFKKDRTDTCG